MAGKTESHVFEYKLRANSAINTTRKLIQLLDKYDISISKTTGYVKKLAQAEKTAGSNASGFQKMGQQAAGMATKVQQAAGVVSRSMNQMSRFAQTAVLTASLQFGKWRYQFDPIIQKMQSFKATVQQVFPNTVKLASTVGQAFRRVASKIEAHTKSINANKIAMKVAQGIHKGFSATLQRLQRLFTSSTSSVKSFTTQLGKNSVIVQNLASAFKILVGYKIGSFFSGGIKEAMHYAEVLNMFNTIMDKSIDNAQKFVDTIQEMYGLDPTTIMSLTSEFYNLASAVEVPTSAAEKMSMGLMNASLNLSSLFDVDITKVAENLNSGMQGMTRAVRKYGLDLRMATLEATALAYGLELDADTTSEANRQALRYLTIVRQARVATGDFAKTIESPANQCRIFKEQMSQLARSIGNLFLPVIQKVLPYLNGFIMAVRTIIQLLASFLGISDISFGGMTDSAKAFDDSMQNASSSADGLKKKLKQLTAPFDELNILNEDTSSSDSSGGGVDSDTLDPTLAKAIEDLNYELEECRMKANDVRDAILSFLGLSWDKDGKLTFDASQLETNLINKFPSWTKTITAFFDNWDGIAAGTIAVWQALGTSMKSVFSGISQGFTNMIQAMNLDELMAQQITELPDKLQAIADWLNNNQDLFVRIGEVIAYVGTAFATWKIISTILSPIIKLSSALGAFNPIVAAVVAAIALLALGFISAWKNSESFRNAVMDLLEAVKDLAQSAIDLIQAVWEVIEPVVQKIADAFMTLWNDTLSVVFVNIITIVAQVLTALINFVTWIVETMGPLISGGLQVVAGVFDTVFSTIAGIVSGLITTLKGLIQFITGVFSGNWKEAWTGIKNIFKGILNMIITLFEGMVNFVIDLVNTMLTVIVGGINSFINTIMSAIEGIAGVIGINISLPRASNPPQIKHIHVDRLAEGGVVTSPTLSWIGEGRYPEAVVPLGNSPQMQDLVQQIANAVSEKPDTSDTPIQVTMYLDGQTLYKSVQKASRDRGIDFKMGAFQR